MAVPLAAHLATLAGGRGHLRAGQPVRPVRQRGGRAVRRAGDGAGLRRRRTVPGQRHRARRSCGFGAAWCAQAIIWVAHYGAAAAGVVVALAGHAAALAWLAAGALFAGLAMGWVLARPWLALALAA